MDTSLLYTVLIILTLALALNLVLSFRLLEMIRNPALLNPPFLPREPGESLPDFQAKTLIARQAFHFGQSNQACVLLFLSSRCPKCKEKIPEIEALLPLLSRAGLSMYLVSKEPKRNLKRFLASSPLLDVVLRVNKDNFKSLNPTLSSPFYLFANHIGELEAGGLIGDEDWLSFLGQMEEIRQQAEVAA